MTDRKPTQEEFSSYFFNTCDEETARIVERWFYEHGKSDDASQMLFNLWQELDKYSSNNDKSKTSKAFAELKSRLEDRSLVKPSFRKVFVNWYVRAAAILLIPVLILSAKLLFDNSPHDTTSWVEKTVPYGDIQKIMLPDGTSVWLNAGSTIIYPEEFGPQIRQVFFDGEAYFDVKKNQSCPFHINTKGNVVKVYGTSFNLRAYREDPNIDLALFDGSVSFTPVLPSSSEILLSPGEYISYECTSGKVTHACFSEDDFSIWRQGGLYFKNKTLAEIAHQLERTYDLTIIIKNPELMFLRYHMAFVNNESIEQILEYIDQDSRIDMIRLGKIVELF